MKYEGLKRHSVRGVKYNGEEICGGFAYYDADEVDAAIAELKNKLMPCLNGDCILTCEVVEKYGKENAELKQKLDEKDMEIESLKASHYAEMVDAGMRERRLKRALWLARAERAKEIKWHEGLERYLQERKKWWPSRFCFMTDDEMYHVWYECWCKVERKCRAKAEEYK